MSPFQPSCAPCAPSTSARRARRSSSTGSTPCAAPSPAPRRVPSRPRRQPRKWPRSCCSLRRRRAPYATPWPSCRRPWSRACPPAISWRCTLGALTASAARRRSERPGASRSQPVWPTCRRSPRRGPSCSPGPGKPGGAATTATRAWQLRSTRCARRVSRPLRTWRTRRRSLSKGAPPHLTSALTRTPRHAPTPAAACHCGTESETDSESHSVTH
mmetsp:Transcript_9494/g.32184  ORF Transcript_9494/g.32184 Transcript_9494/m.32184 type:complete len:215 (-) Transcript_9494:1055-1699(-)